MVTLHSKVMVLALTSMSFTILGQTQGCDLAPLRQLLASVGLASTAADDHGGLNNQGSDDQSPDDNGGQTGNPSDGTLREMTAVLTGSPGSGSADYRQIGTRYKLDIEVEDQVAGQVLDIMVNGQPVGTVTVDSLGKGEIEFDTNPEQETEHAAWPDALAKDLPAGTTVQVGSLSGVLNPV